MAIRLTINFHKEETIKAMANFIFISRKTLRTLAMLTVFALTHIVTSCNLMHDDYASCVKELRVEFAYDMNMEFADAFKSQVSTVTLCAYDSDGKLALKKSETVEAIENRGGYMTLEIEPGKYRLQVWAEGPQRYADSYDFSTQATAENGIDALDSRIRRSSRSLDHDLTPLFHGFTDADLTLPGYGIRTAMVRLTKDTNIVRTVIQNASGKRLNANDFSFFIDDDNSWLAYDNSPLKEDSITYRPWSQYDGTIGNDNNQTPSPLTTTRFDGDTQVSAVVAETTVNRLFVSKHPRLRVVNNTNGKTVFSIPLIDYALLVKGKYNAKMSDQEYLDRQDEYNFVFFVDDNLNWLSASIIVNSWRIVIQNTDLK